MAQSVAELRKTPFVPMMGSMPLGLPRIAARWDRVTARKQQRNDQADWNHFDPRTYCAANYSTLRDDDQEIAEGIRDFFAEKLKPGVPRRAIDVGTGSNLYPALAMMPFCASVQLHERSRANLRWLYRQRLAYSTNWDAFARLYSDNPVYQQHGQGPRKLRLEFLRKARIRSGNVFTLPEKRWDLGTMFFVACSMSTDIDEFARATRFFVRSLKPGAPFAAAFMTDSDGYYVGDRWFPAVSVGPSEIHDALHVVAKSLDLTKIHSHVPVRPGVGMILATGLAA